MSGTTVKSGAAARRERNRAEMRASILQAAHQQIFEKGAESLTIRGIASALGYSPGAIYEYFESKDAIIQELYFEGQGGLAETMREILEQVTDGENALDILMRMVMKYRSMTLENPEVYRLVFSGSQCPPPEDLIEKFGDSMGGLTYVQEVIRQGIADGEIEEIDPTSVALMIWSLVHGILNLELGGHLELFEVLELDGRRPDPAAAASMRERRYRDGVRTLLRGIATGKGQALLDT